METSQNQESTSKCGGVKKAARWVARMFGYKAENKYARAVWYVFATAAALVTLYVAVAATILIVESISDNCSSRKYRRMVNSPTYLHDYNNTYVSPYVVYHDGWPSYLYNTVEGRRTVMDITKVCKSSDGDSLTFYATNDMKGCKRGYFNRFTGEVVIPAQYDKAWVFSEGLACVLEKGTLHFIDHKGQSVMGKVFPYTINIDDYCFHNGLCQMLGDNERVGLINKQGNWVVEPQFNRMQYDTTGFWLVRDEESNYGLLDSQGKMLLPIEYEDITVNHCDNCIYVVRLDHLSQVLDLDGNIVNPCNYSEVEVLKYGTDEYDEYGDQKYVSSNCLSYRTEEWYYGLMDRNGNMLTPPIYSEITAIGPDRFHGDGPNGSVILDSKGKECGEKL